MELKKIIRPAMTVLVAQGKVNVASGQRLKIETSPGGEELLNEECPAGKVWKGEIKLDITEQDI